jgi:hypothetical protein
MARLFNLPSSFAIRFRLKGGAHALANAEVLAKL